MDPQTQSSPTQDDARSVTVADVCRRFRQQMPVSHRWAYYDHAAVGPLSQPAHHAITQWADEAMLDGDVHWPSWAKRLGTVRRQVAEGCHADTDEIVFVANTSDGINLVAQAIAWREGDNVVMPGGEFPSNYYPWKGLEDRGVSLRVVPTDPQGRFSPADLRAVCDDRTRLITCSWVGFASGFRCDVAGISEVAQELGAYFFLDAIQGLGVYPLDLADIPIDFLAADGHKWMLGPEGFGVLYLRKSRLDELAPNRLGWNSVVHTFDYQKLELILKPNAQRFEPGSHNMACAQALGASLGMLAEAGWGPRNRQLMDLVLSHRDTFAEDVRRLGGQVHSDGSPNHASGIVSFEFPGHDPVEVRRILLEQQVVLSCRGGRLRASLHGYNDETDRERFLAAAQVALGKS